jgi:hypothetical protein
MSLRWITCLCAALGTWTYSAAFSNSAEIVLPQNRQAFYSGDSVEIAVAGLTKDQSATVELMPEKPGAMPVKLDVQGDGTTINLVLPSRSLAPNIYSVKLDGKEATKLTISSGVARSTMLVSQTSTRAPEGGANYVLGNAFSFSHLDPQGQPAKDVRGRRSLGMSSFEQAVAADLPYICYMYWTGYVLHKPFGDEKSWASPSMNESMRLLSFHTAQRLRRFGPLIRGLGPIDEPGLAWGKTPAGGMASGFPNWDEQGWYEARGWKYTQDIANQSDADWMKYLAVRSSILGENYGQAKQDIETVWPEAIFAGDLYAPLAIMDGTDPWNQRFNDIPTSHVFFDFMGGPLSTCAQMQIEKSHDPGSKLAHAMNGQLIGVRGPQKPLYHLLMNDMLCAGLDSNWWLNTGGMTNEEIAAVNGPAERLGPWFHELLLGDRDVALLWSFTELGMRQKEICAQESTKKTGEQLKLLVPIPDATELPPKELATSAYEVGGVYAQQVGGLHQILRRAGYAPQVVHEKLLPGGVLKNYKVLVIVGQTFAFPRDVQKALADFVAAGGQIVTDSSTTLKFDRAVTIAADISAAAIRGENVRREQAKAAAGMDKTAASLAGSNWEETKFHRDRVAAVKAAMQQTKARPVFTSDEVSLVGERHVGGEGALYMVLNAHEELKDKVGADNEYPRYNPAPRSATFTLQGIPAGSAVHAKIEGVEWNQVSRTESVGVPITADFAAGEMKLYVAAPRMPKGLTVAAEAAGGMLNVRAQLEGMKMPWPFTMEVLAADGRKLYSVYRATKADGSFAESLPLGSNIAAGTVTVRVTSPIGNLKDEKKLDLAAAAVAAAPVTDAARVIDEAVIRTFLHGKPAVVIAIGNDVQRAIAGDLAAKLAAAGIKATVKQEKEVVRKALYPRVWDPYARLVKASGDEKQPPAEVKQRVTLATDAAGLVSAKSTDGKAVADWKTPGTLITVAGEGYLDWIAPHEFAYEAGCKLFVNEQRQFVVLKGEQTEAKTTDEFRARWARPWTRLDSHVGGFQLPPSLPEAYTTDAHLILLGDSTTSEAVAALQASELLLQTVDAKYPGPGKSLVSFAWSPFGLEKNVIVIGATDEAGLRAGAECVGALASP